MRTPNTPSTVLVTLAALTAALGTNPNQKIPVSRKWLVAAQDFLGVAIPVSDAPVKSEDAPKAHDVTPVRPAIGEH